MSAFSDQDFDSKGYARFRPSYDDSLYEFIVHYHEGGDELAVDIGCGSGQASYPLTRYFKRVIGTDLSGTMVATATSRAEEEPSLRGRISFQQSPAEELTFLENNSVDLITVAQCVHWFQLDKFFDEVYRVLKPNGTIAIWGYADPVFNDPVADRLSMEFTYEDPTKLGPYWEQPGRNILRGLLDEVKVPAQKFKDVETFKRTPGDAQNDSTSSPLSIKREMPLTFYGNYVKTWSSYHNWKRSHKDQADIADLYLKELQSKMKWTPATTVKLEWLTVLKLARKI